MDPLRQEAESRKYSDDQIKLLPLKDDNWAVFDSHGNLRFIGPFDELPTFIRVVQSNPPKRRPRPGTLPIDLKELGI